MDRVFSKRQRIMTHLLKFAWLNMALVTCKMSTSTSTHAQSFIYSGIEGPTNSQTYILHEKSTDSTTNTLKSTQERRKGTLIPSGGNWTCRWLTWRELDSRRPRFREPETCYLHSVLPLFSASYAACSTKTMRLMTTAAGDEEEEL